MFLSIWVPYFQVLETNAEPNIFEIDLALSHDSTRRDDNRGSWASRLDFRQKELHKEEVCEVIDAELHLKPVFGLAVRADHHTRHKDHMVNLGHICQALLNCLADVAQVAEVNVEEPSFDIGLGIFDLFGNRSYIRLLASTQDEELGISGSQLDGELTRDGLLGDTSNKNCSKAKC